MCCHFCEETLKKVVEEARKTPFETITAYKVLWRDGVSRYRFCQYGPGENTCANQSRAYKPSSPHGLHFYRERRHAIQECEFQAKHGADARVVPVRITGRDLIAVDDYEVVALRCQILPQTWKEVFGTLPAERKHTV